MTYHCKNAAGVEKKIFQGGQHEKKIVLESNMIVNFPTTISIGNIVLNVDLKRISQIMKQIILLLLMF